MVWGASMNVRYRVELSQAERDQLIEMLSGGKHAARKLKRAQIMVAADALMSDAVIAASVSASESTVYLTKRRFVGGNLELALSEEPRPGSARKLSGKEAALLIASACKAQYPRDIIALVVLWRLRYKLSLRDLAEIFLTRGFIFTYEAVQEWEAKLTPALAENLRRKRKGRVGRSYIDETYIRVRGQWRYLYRAIDRDGALVDVMLSERRFGCRQGSFSIRQEGDRRHTGPGHDRRP
jgi:hypothetical protein